MQTTKPHRVGPRNLGAHVRKQIQALSPLNTLLCELCTAQVPVGQAGKPVNCISVQVRVSFQVQEVTNLHDTVSNRISWRR